MTSIEFRVLLAFLTTMEMHRMGMITDEQYKKILFDNAEVWKGEENA